jgi:hypothetical protein
LQRGEIEAKDVAITTNMCFVAIDGQFFATIFVPIAT